MQKSFADWKIQTSKYLGCIQNNSLLPFATCCMGVIIGIMLFYILIISLISLGIGIGVKFIMPHYDLLGMIKNIFIVPGNNSSNSQNTGDKTTDFMLTKVTEILKKILNIIVILGDQHFILGVISTISCIIIIIAIAKKLQIIFFISLFIFFIIGCLFIELGTEFWPFLIVKLKEILNFVLIDKFDWDRCEICDPSRSFDKINTPTPNDKYIFIDVAISLLKGNFNCCGVDSPEDFGIKAKNNRIPFFCCLNITNGPPDLKNPTECYLRNAPPGCVGKFIQLMDRYKIYFGMYSVTYIICGLLMFSIVIIGILETIYFYLSGSHKTDLKIIK